MAITGLKAKMYRNTGTFATPVWVEIVNIRDNTLNLEKGTADVSNRASDFRRVLTTLKNGTDDFQMVWDVGDPDFTAIQTAFFDDTLIDFAIMDGDITVSGNQGLRGEFEIVNFSRAEPLEDAVVADVSIALGFSANLPFWFTVP